MGDSGKLRFYELDHDESKMRLLINPLPRLKRPGYGARKTRRKAVEGNAGRPVQQGKPPIKNLPRTAGMAGGGQKRLYGKKTNENPLWQGKPLSKGRGTQALLKEIRDTENLSPTVGMAGVG